MSEKMTLDELYRANEDMANENAYWGWELKSGKARTADKHSKKPAAKPVVKKIARYPVGASRWVHVDVEEILAATDKALLCVIDGEELWLPRSQVDEDEKHDKGDCDVTISITEWIAKEKGIA